jgi:hypothetical protein
VVGNNLGKGLLGPFGNIDTIFSCSGRPIRSSRKHFQKELGLFVNVPLHALMGPFEAVRNILGRDFMSPFVNIDASFGWSNGLIQSGRNHYWKETTGPILEHRYRLYMLRWAHSKQSGTLFTGPLSRTSILAAHALASPFKAVGNILGRKPLGPFSNIDAGFACSGGSI